MLLRLVGLASGGSAPEMVADPAGEAAQARRGEVVAACWRLGVIEEERWGGCLDVLPPCVRESIMIRCSTLFKGAC